MEVFTFIFMGGDLCRITVLPIRDDRTAAVAPLHGGDKAADQESVVVGIEESVPRPTGSGSFVDRSDPAVRAVLDKFATFDAHEASCYLPDDKQMILGVIESGIGSVDAFNQLVRKTFAAKEKGKAAVNSGRRLSRNPSAAIVIGMEESSSRRSVSDGGRSASDGGLRRPSLAPPAKADSRRRSLAPPPPV